MRRVSSSGSGARPAHSSGKLAPADDRHQVVEAAVARVVENIATNLRAMVPEAAIRRLIELEVRAAMQALPPQEPRPSHLEPQPSSATATDCISYRVDEAAKLIGVSSGKVEDANRVTRFTARLERAIGAIGVRFLRAILAEGHTFASYATARGKAGERGAAQIGTHFRFLLEGLTEAHHTARGPERPTPRDVYQEQADGLAARLARLRTEDDADGEHEDLGEEERLEEEFREMLAEPA